ncbi:MAG: hypothetical protein OXD29_12765 [Roseovarius sp.]|nr:hypothetical protein [Roseovarius sp.]MCY4291493.1 hypothetical protein [Roseovarius sp.]
MTPPYVSSVWKLFLLTLSEPGKSARLLLYWRTRVSNEALWLILTITTILISIILWSLIQLITPFGEEVKIILQHSSIYNSPFIFAFMQWCRAIMSICAICLVGMFMGGEANSGEVVIFVTWLQIVSFLLTAIQMAMGLILPVLSPVLTLIVIVVMARTLLTYMNELNRFENLFKSLALLFFSFIGVVVMISVILSIFLLLFGIPA